MDRFDTRNAKLISLILAICFIFVLAIANAYKYLPSDNSIQNGDSNAAEIVEVDNENSEVVDDEENINQEEVVEESSSEPEIIDDIPQQNISEEPEAENDYQKFFNLAQEKMSNKDYFRAIENYEKALNLTSDIQEKAVCNENIAVAYATLRRYGTALSYAQKAYNSVPTSNREVLLARLYYKTGNIDKATNRINNVLQRDFSVEH